MTRIVRGACPLDCPDTCAWRVTVDDGRAVDLRGDREHPITRGTLCGKVDHYLDAVYDADRLLYPMRRVGAKGEGRFERIGWDEAIALVADGLRATTARHGPESILPYYFAGTMGLIQGWTMGPRLFAAMGASRLATTICSAALHAALRATFGGPIGFDPEEIARARLILLWGTNVLATNSHQWRFVLDARKRGAHVVTIDPIATDTARRSDEHVALLPGTDAALALGLMRVVSDMGAADREWLDRYTVGWPALERRLDAWPVERAARVCGIEERVIQRLGQRLAESRPTAIRLGIGLQRHGGAGAAIRAICAIPAVTGDFRYPGGGLACVTNGLIPIDTDSVAFPSDLPQPAARVVNMSRLGEALTELDAPPVGALVVFDANPAAVAPRQLRVREGLSREDLFTVVIEQRRTDTVDYADVVLPATMQLEHADLQVAYGHLYIAWNEPAIEPLGEALPNAEIFRRIAAALEMEHPRLRDSDLDLARQLLDTPGCRAAGVTLEALRERGWMRVGPPPGTAPFAKGGFATASGKVELYSEQLARGGYDGLVNYAPPHEIADPALARRYGLVLLAPAHRHLINSTFGSLPWHLSKVGPPLIHLHPDDAAARGIEGGDEVRVWNDRGAFTARALIDPATRPGVAFTYKMHWAKLSPGNANVNATTPERDTDLGGGPTFHDNRVEVEPITRAAAR